MESEVAVVRQIDCRTAEELLDALRPRSDNFKNLRVGGFPKPTEQHVFRGHEDDRFELVPKAWRMGSPPVKLKSRHSWGSVQPNPDSENKEPASLRIERQAERQPAIGRVGSTSPVPPCHGNT